MFTPTHTMVSRSRKIPVRLARGKQRFLIFTEQEWAQKQKPAFEMHPKLGFFCRGVQVLGYRLEPCAVQASGSEALASPASA
ncbi:MAG: hypothetical protein HC886_13665 [Leptolyngbyaceae cyanobacterium SM1_1_3]|nr:hypothetical protein [Leptolyngbyaceae cyanobacterium SM1_1_3]NJN04281.1 hypothetical protein [Leptolyngbyaceae cyanobacterium RM1_1_2]NJO08502.1 hypothetical protein [Leptolyngbyaceae cyanobacterium SL_1_1]